MERFTTISVDGHAAPPMADFRPYVEARYHEEFDDFVRWHEEMTGGSRITPAGFSGRPQVEDYTRKVIDTGWIDGEHDPDVRLAVLEQEGIVAEVLFPNRMPFANRRSAQLTSPELIEAGRQAFNRWVVDFCSTHPERFGAQLVVSFEDVERAVDSIHWAKANGMRAVDAPGMDPSRPLFWDPVYEPIWSACEELGLPLNFHGGSGLPDYTTALTPEAPVSLLGTMVATEFKLFSPRPLWFMIYSGVLERHPALELVFTENHCDWIPGTLANMDYSWEKSRRTETALSISCRRPPSEYWYRQCYAGASVCSRAEVARRGEIGVHNMMFGADFPHMESTIPRTKNVLNVLLGGNAVPDEEARLFLGDNAARVFGFDPDVLHPIAMDVGFDPAEILKDPPPDDELDWPSYGWDVLRPPR